MQLIVTRVEDKEWNSKIEFSYNEHEYMLNYTAYEPATLIVGIDTDYKCVIHCAFYLSDIVSMIVNNESKGCMGGTVNTTEFFTMAAALIDKNIRDVYITDARKYQPLNNIEILLQYSTE